MIKEGDGLYWHAFNETVMFPMFLWSTTLGKPCEKPVHLQPDYIFPRWFTKFTKLPVFKEYRGWQEQFAEHIGKQPFGLIFPRKGFQYGLVLHNGDMGRFAPLGEGYYIYATKGRKHQTYVVQTFKSLLDRVEGNGWKPSRDLLHGSADR